MIAYNPADYPNARSSLRNALGVPDNATFQGFYTGLQKQVNPHYVTSTHTDHCWKIRNFLFKFIEQHVPSKKQQQAKQNVFQHLTYPFLKRQKMGDRIMETFQTVFDLNFDPIPVQKEKDVEMETEASEPQLWIDFCEDSSTFFLQMKAEQEYEQATKELFAFLSDGSN